MTTPNNVHHDVLSLTHNDNNPLGFSPKEEISQTIELQISGLSDEFVEYIFASTYGRDIESAILYFLNSGVASADAILACNPTILKGNNGWNATVGPMVHIENFSFIQRPTLDKNIFVKTDHPKYFLAVRIARISENPLTLSITPQLLELPSKNTLIMPGYLFAKELDSIEAYSDAERNFG